MSDRIILANTNLRPILGVLLDEFVGTICRLPEGAARLTSYADLPVRFQTRVDSLAPHAEWRAWSDGTRIWFMVGCVLRQRGQECAGPLLRAMFFNQDAYPIASGEWRRLGPCMWKLHNVLEPEWVANEAFVHQRSRPDRGGRARKDRERMRLTSERLFSVGIGQVARKR